MSFSVQNSSLVLVDHFNFKWAFNVASPQTHNAAVPFEYRIPFQASSPGGCFSNVFPSPPGENAGQLLAHCTPELGKDFYFQLKWQSQGQGDALLTLLPDAK